MPNSEDNFWKIIETLGKYEVEYLIVGGFGAVIHGAPMATKDIDIMLKKSDENFERLAIAMIELSAQYRGVTDLEVPWSGKLISSQIFGNFTCEYGDFDVIREMPSAVKGETVDYEDLKPASSKFNPRGLTVYVASLEDIVISKRGAGRPKDHLTLPALEKFLEQRNGSADDGPRFPGLD